MQLRTNLLKKRFCWFLFPLAYFILGYILSKEDRLSQNPEYPPMGNHLNLWVSMSLCYGGNFGFGNKRAYSYARVAPLTVGLWRHLTNFEVLVQVVHSKDNFTREMQKYQDLLQMAGAKVKWMKTDGDECILTSQVIRMFAYLHPEIRSNDIVTTVDVNAFVMSPNILKPVTDNLDVYKVWVYVYRPSFTMFNQNFISMRSGTWREILGFQDEKENLSEWFQRMKKILRFSDKPEMRFWWDQVISTHAIVKNKLCQVNNARAFFLRYKDLNFDPNFDDSRICFHGEKQHHGCHGVQRNCSWKHFDTYEPFSKHVEFFKEITSNSYPHLVDAVYNMDDPALRSKYI